MLKAGCSAFPFYTPTKPLIRLYFKYKTVLVPKSKIYFLNLDIYNKNVNISNKLVLECSWNHEYFGSLAKLT